MITAKYQNKYRIPSARLQNWDYRWPAAYFITICTLNREYYFGNVVNGNMQLTGTGIIADIMWHEIKNHTIGIDLDAFVVMAVTKHARRLGFDFAWQTRFYDHVIHDRESFNKIQTYIIENPHKWVDDKFHNL